MSQQDFVIARALTLWPERKGAQSCNTVFPTTRGGSSDAQTAFFEYLRHNTSDGVPNLSRTDFDCPTGIAY
jgi:hypothetical protein